METTEPMKFSDSTELSPEILKAVAKMGFQEMTPVQQQTLPLMMEGRDVIAIAPTGTGKTCAFGIPMLEYVNLNDRRVQELVLFSATTNQDVLTIAWKYQNDPVEVRIEATKENRPQITQYVINTEREQKYENLLYLLDSDVYQKIMVFINTKDMTQRLCKRLKDAGYPAECLHGDMRQSVRNEVMQGFRKGKFQILLATDVAARGIDVDDVEAVINYDLPNENEYYLHRIGRTGRAKRHGVAFTLLTYTESVRFDEILKYIMAKPIPLHFDEMGILCKEDGEPFFENM